MKSCIVPHWRAFNAIRRSGLYIIFIDRTR